MAKKKRTPVKRGRITRLQEQIARRDSREASRRAVAARRRPAAVPEKAEYINDAWFWQESRRWQTYGSGGQAYVTTKANVDAARLAELAKSSRKPAIRVEMKQPWCQFRWHDIKEDGFPDMGKRYLVTDGVELAHVEYDGLDKHGAHFLLVPLKANEAPTEEFADVTHWCEEPLLPNGKRPRAR